MKVTSLQLPVIEGDKQAALESACQSILEAKGSDLIVLPELWNIGFMDFSSYISLAEKTNGATLSMLKELAQKVSAYIHSGSIVEEDGGKYYNSSFLIGPNGSVLAKYRKIHLFGYGSQERTILTAGRRVRVLQTEIGTFGLATCFDLRFPELFRNMVTMGAEVYLVSSAWPMQRLEHWRLFNKVRALENQCYLISANSCGVSCGCTFAGNSMVVHPDGHILAEAGKGKEMLQCEIDLKDVAQVRYDFPSLASRTSWL